MSRTKPTEAERAQVMIPCVTCSALDGDWCTVFGGGWAGRLHPARSRPWEAGWREGYKGGLFDTLQRAEIAWRRDQTLEELIDQLKRDSS